MYCTKCGKQIEDGSKFCEFCGASFTNYIQGAQAVQSTPPNVPPSVSPSAPLNPSNLSTNSKINDEGIKALITQHRGHAEAGTPYFYGYVQDNFLLPFLTKNYVLNFTANGLHLYKLGLSTQLKVSDYSFVQISDIKSVKMKTGLMQWSVKIVFQQNGKVKKMNVKANKKVLGINEQLPNLERVKAMFNQ